MVWFWVALAVFGLMAAGLGVRRGMIRRPQLGQALVISRAGQPPRVAFDRALVRPLVDHAETVDLTTRAVSVERARGASPVTADGLRVDIRAEIAVQVGRKSEDVLRVVQSVGCERANDPSVISERFAARFERAVEEATKAVEFDHAVSRLDALEEDIARRLGDDLDGYVVVDVKLTRFELTPAEALETDNLADARALARLRARDGR